ncbi:MAG: hypothetical protein M1829_003177 [Trizodia sp. TS-e1964]|nr:MAG: hypothetical protein M1829_003177 [Trizodia sp. TS-e1964]
MALIESNEAHVREADGEAETRHGDPKTSKAYFRVLDRTTYQGSVIFNLVAFMLPALYSTLSKLWVANIDSSQVVTTDIYTYIGVIAQVLNDGLPRAAWLIIGDRSTRTVASRISLSYTLISVQIILGALMAIVFVAASEDLAAAFVPVEVRQSSLTYVRISSVSALSSAMQVSVSACTRALDHPDVPLVISSVQFVVNIMLDLLIISKFHVGSFVPTVNTQACVRLACDLSSALAGLGYFLYIAANARRQSIVASEQSPKWSIQALKTLARPSVYTFIESAIRNALYLWLVSRIVLMGKNYATAWGVFNTIRWGLVMVPVQALEASTLTFVGHKWGQWRARVGIHLRNPKASWPDLLEIVHPALVSCVIVLVVEVIICIALSTRGMEAFAYYLSESTEVSQITQTMWKTIDWCYIFFGLNYQLAAILLAASPRWFLYQALGSNILWILPWAIVMTKVQFAEDTAWTYYAIIFGGALVFDFFDVLLTVVIWAWRLRRGKVRVRAIQTSM